jgi:hypothetical protein
VPTDCVEIEKNSMSAPDRKAYWDLRETLHWICWRKEEGVAAVRDMKEGNRVPLAMFTAKGVLDPISLPLIAEYDFKADYDATVWHPDSESPNIAEFGMLGPDQALNYLLRQAHNRRIRVTAIKCDRYRVKQIPVPLVELYDLEFRITPGHRIARVGLWSRSRNCLMLRSPQFLRADVIRVWPARKKKKNLAVSGMILSHLRVISTSAAPLTKADAQRRCLAEVPDAYSWAFRKAWVLLDPSSKRGRGKHGLTASANLRIKNSTSISAL